MKIVFPHVPKCAGSSVVSQLGKYRNVHLDYFNHPTWIHAPDRQEGALRQASLKQTLAGQDEWIVFGHFSASTYDDLPYDLKVILLRDPLERAVSHFHYIRDVLEDSDVTRRRHAEVGPIKEGRMTLAEFVGLEHIRFIYSRFYLRDLVVDDRLLVFPLTNLDRTFEVLHERTGLRLNHAVRKNAGRYDGAFDHFRPLFEADTALYRRLTGAD